MTSSRTATYRHFAKYARKERYRLAAIVALTTVLALLAAVEPLPVKLLVDNALGDAPLHPFLERWTGTQPDPWILVVVAALASLLILTLEAALNAVASWLWASAGQRMVVDLTSDLFARLQRLSLQFHRSRPQGEWLSRLTSDSWSVYSFAAVLVAAPLQEVATFASVGIVAWNLDRQLAALCMGMAPFLAASAWWFGNRLKSRARRGREAQADLVSFTRQTLVAMPVVQAFRGEERNRQQFDLLAGRAVAAGQSSVFWNSSYGLVNGAIVTLGTAMVLYAGGLRALDGTLALGTLLAFLAYARTLQRSVEGLLKVYGGLKPLEASMERVAEVLSSSEVVPEEDGAVCLPPFVPGVTGHIRFENVTYGYDPARPVLNHIDIEIRPGETLALVGHTGAGKTTLAAMLPRFQDPQEGRILFDGIDLRRLQLHSLRSQIALVLQDSLLLSVSVADNIAYGRPEASRQEIVSAAVAANAHRFIEHLPEGYDTVLGEGGAHLSGGERQRLAIARAILRNAPVLILDEPTSALDSVNEALVMEALERLMRGRTTLILAHRLSTVRRAHKIAVLDHGRLAEYGTHEQLLEARGTYARFWRLQSLSSLDDTGKEVA